MTLHIENLQLQIVIGILPHERENPQIVIINGNFEYDFNGHFIDYGAIQESIIKHLKNGKFKLLEEALSSLHSELKRDFSELKKVSLTIKKPEIFSDSIVGASLEKNY